MFYGLGTGDRNLKKDINKFVALSPCVVPSKPLWKNEERVKMEEGLLQKMKILCEMNFSGLLHNHNFSGCSCHDQPQ